MFLPEIIGRKKVEDLFCNFGTIINTLIFDKHS